MVRKALDEQYEILLNDEMTDASLVATYMALCTSLEQWRTMNPFLLTSPTNKHYKKYISLRSSVIYTCDRILLELKQRTIKMGLYLLGEIQQQSLDQFYNDLTTKDSDNIAPDIAIAANKISNGADAILSSYSLMNRGADPILINTQNSAKESNIDELYYFLSQCKRSLSNKRFNNVSQICIAGISCFNIRDELATFVCGNCSFHIISNAFLLIIFNFIIIIEINIGFVVVAIH
eukprot:399573_1